MFIVHVASVLSSLSPQIQETRATGKYISVYVSVLIFLAPKPTTCSRVLW